MLTKYLIIGPAWVGDMVMAQGLFKALKTLTPESEITVIAPAWTRALLERMPEVNNTLELPFKHGEFDLLKRWRLGKSLREKKFTHAFVLPNSWKSAIIPFAAHIPKRTGYKGEMRFGLLNNIKYLDKKKFPLMIQRFIALASEKLALENIFFPKLISNSKNQENIFKKFNLPFNSLENKSAHKIIALCPGAEFGESKRWPVEYFAEIANYFLHKNITVCLLGSANDINITNAVNILTENKCLNLAGKTTLGEAIDLIAVCDFVITNDSGLMHIAAGLNIPLIALYGSTDTKFTPPLSPKAKTLSLSLSCQPCFQRECPLKHHDCMKKLFPADVIKAYESCAF